MLDNTTKPNLSYFFIDQVRLFSNILTTEPMQKEDFYKKVVDAYKDRANSRIRLFLHSIKNSTFDTIQVDEKRENVLINEPQKAKVS